MNIAILMGRLTRDPEARWIERSGSQERICVARYTIAVDRRQQKTGEQSADFIQCVTFGKAAEFAEKYFKKGIKIAVEGRIQTGSYTNKDGARVYTTDVVVEKQEFAESKNQNAEDREERDRQAAMAAGQMEAGDFMSIPDGIEEELPFS